MGFEEKESKKAISETKEVYFSEDLSSADKFKLEFQKQANNHSLKMKKTDLGWVGKIFGDGKVIPDFSAFLVIILGIVLTAFSIIYDSADFKSTSISIITLGLGYLFGKS